MLAEVEGLMHLRVLTGRSRARMADFLSVRLRQDMNLGTRLPRFTGSGLCVCPRYGQN